MKELLSSMFLILFTFACAPAPTPKTFVVVVTATPLPVTATNTSDISAIQTMKAQIRNQQMQTALASLPTSTSTLTPIATSIPTKTSKPTVAKALAVDRRDFVTYADKYKGQYVVISGIVFNINGNTQLQLFMGGDYNSPVYVISARSFDDIYKDDDVVVYGTAYGMDCNLTNSFGSTMCQAEIRNACVVHHIYQSKNTKNKNGVRPTPDYSTNLCP
jgi:hypothetical protein